MFLALMSLLASALVPGAGAISPGPLAAQPDEFTGTALYSPAGVDPLQDFSPGAVPELAHRRPSGPPHSHGSGSTQPPLLRPAPPTPASTASTYVPIVMYHYIRVNPDPRDRAGYSLSVTPAMFRAQMDYLAGNGFHVVSLRDAVEAIRLHRALPPHAIVLTFDDGYADFFTSAVPELRRHGFTATNFVVSGFVGRGGYMNWSQVQAADAMGFNIGAHTVDHVALAGIAPARAAWEISQSKATLEAMLGHPVLDFAYPYGSFNAGVAARARQLGFASASSTIGGAWHWSGTLMNLHRVRVGGGMSLAGFAQLVGGPPPR